jgi:hypothetical protein
MYTLAVATILTNIHRNSLGFPDRNSLSWLRTLLIILEHTKNDRKQYCKESLYCYLPWRTRFISYGRLIISHSKVTQTHYYKD